MFTLHYILPVDSNVFRDTTLRKNNVSLTRNLSMNLPKFINMKWKIRNGVESVFLFTCQSKRWNKK